MPTIEIYPDCPTPDWMKVGATCFCLGEAQDVFTVAMVLDKAAVLTDAAGYNHGTESFTKLYQTLDEWERRVRPKWSNGIKMNKKSPLEWSPEEMAQHVQTVREGVELFLRESGVGRNFTELVDFINTKFRCADEQMFKEWVQKEFPGQLVYTHKHEAEWTPDDE